MPPGSTSAVLQQNGENSFARLNHVHLFSFLTEMRGRLLSSQIQLYNVLYLGSSVSCCNGQSSRNTQWIITLMVPWTKCEGSLLVLIYWIVTVQFLLAFQRVMGIALWACCRNYALPLRIFGISFVARSTLHIQKKKVKIYYRKLNIWNAELLCRTDLNSVCWRQCTFTAWGSFLFAC